MGDLASFIRHAERFGTAEVFETAAAELDVHDLGRLSLRLQNIDPKWRLPQEDARALAVRLIAEGVDVAWTCRATGISRRTLNRALSDAQDNSNQAPEPAFQSGESWTIRPTEGDGMDKPDLSLFDGLGEVA